jgi:hypothetical protein
MIPALVAPKRNGQEMNETQGCVPRRALPADVTTCDPGIVAGNKKGSPSWIHHTSRPRYSISAAKAYAPTFDHVIPRSAIATVSDFSSAPVAM